MQQRQRMIPRGKTDLIAAKGAKLDRFGSRFPSRARQAETDTALGLVL